MKVKKITTFLLALCSATCFFFGVDKLADKAMATGANMASTQDNITGITIEEFLGKVYKEGDVAQLPDMIDGSFVLYDPNGNGYVNNSITFSKAGAWKMRPSGNSDWDGPRSVELLCTIRRVLQVIRKNF